MLADDGLDCVLGPDVAVEHLALELPGVLDVDEQPLPGRRGRVTRGLPVALEHDVQGRLEELFQGPLLRLAHLGTV